MKYLEIDVDVRDVQIVQMEMLLEFDRICLKHNISYQLFAGTLLGAIRHKGFIPWDDDVDVCMMRCEYERFIKCCEKELDKKYFLQTNKTDSNSVIQFAKLRKNNTVFINRTDCRPESHTGVYIDVFPMDNVKPDTLLGKIQQLLFRFLYAITTSSVKERILFANKRTTKFVRSIFHFILKIIPKAYVDKLIEKTLRMFEKEKAEYICHLTNGITKKRFNRYLRRRETFCDIIEWEFEGHMFPVPANYHEVLTRIFGDYMQLPPEEERYPHHGVIKVDL